MRGSQNLTYLSPDRVAQGPIHFKEETVSLCHPERSEGSLAGQRSFAALRMTILKRLRLTRKTSSLKCIGPCGCQVQMLSIHSGHCKVPLKDCKSPVRKNSYSKRECHMLAEIT